MTEDKVLEIVRSISGTDENGFPKATSVIQDQRLYLDEQGNVQVSSDDEAGTVGALVAISVESDEVKASIQFDDFNDVDYLRFHSLINNFYNKEMNKEGHILVVTFSDTNTIQNYMTIQVGTVVFDGKSPIIRVIGKADKAAVYQLENEFGSEEEKE